jgi:hypothetical protein
VTALQAKEIETYEITSITCFTSIEMAFEVMGASRCEWMMSVQTDALGQTAKERCSIKLE